MMICTFCGITTRGIKLPIHDNISCEFSEVKDNVDDAVSRIADVAATSHPTALTPPSLHTYFHENTMIVAYKLVTKFLL
jgi:hypothetical protein